METLCYKICGWLYISYFLWCSLGYCLKMMCRCPGSAGLSGCWGDWFHMESVGEERNAYTNSFPWLVQYGTRGRCPFRCKDFLVTFWIVGSHICLSWTQEFRTLLSKTSHSGLTLQTVNFCTCSPHVYREFTCSMTNRGTPHQWRPFPS